MKCVRWFPTRVALELLAEESPWALCVVVRTVELGNPSDAQATGRYPPWWTPEPEPYGEFLPTLCLRELEIIPHTRGMFRLRMMSNKSLESFDIGSGHGFRRLEWWVSLMMTLSRSFGSMKVSIALSSALSPWREFRLGG